MALFGKKKDGNDGVEVEASENPVATVSPAKARRFFDHAKTVHEATNYEYAMQSWLRGLTFDPSSVDGLVGFFLSAASFLGENPKGKVSKELGKTFGGEKYAVALLNWGIKPGDGAASLKAVEAAAKLGQDEPAYWLATRAYNAMYSEKKPSKKLFKDLMDVCQGFGAYDIAVKAGQTAVDLDPNDGQLQVDVRNLAAQATMTKGGFDNTGKEGGFRDMIRDADKQRQLIEDDRVVKTGDVKDRLVKAAADAYQQHPEDVPTIRKYIKSLLDRGTTDDEKLAMNISNKAFEVTQQYGFKQQAGEITIRVARRALSKYRDAAEADPDSAEAKSNFAKAQRKFLEMEIDLLTKQIDAYPTDLGLKFELGKRQFQAENYEEAVALFQDAKDEAKNRSLALNMLGQSFHKMGWSDEAISTFRLALDGHSDANNLVGMALRYGLMESLQGKAESEKDPASAEEAEKLASGIAVQKFSYRDIRDRRTALKELIARLRDG